MSTPPQSSRSQSIHSSEENVQSDDWAGLTDRVERRRRQNRVNQRAYRNRQRLLASQSTNDKNQAGPASASGELVVSTSRAPVENTVDEISSAAFTPAYKRVLLDRFMLAASQSYLQGSPSSDHLLTLTKVNVFRAFGLNLQSVGWSLDQMEDDAISPFCAIGPRKDSFPSETDMPPSLRPTKVQKTIAHHPWLDFFPLPKMRDNLIQAGDEWDDELLCHDIMGFWDTTAEGEEAGLVVWGDPWDIRNWELTEGFLKKWQWIVRGCPELMESTNAWRARRRQTPIFRYL